MTIQKKAGRIECFAGTRNQRYLARRRADRVLFYQPGAHELSKLPRAPRHPGCFTNVNTLMYRLYTTEQHHAEAFVEIGSEVPALNQSGKAGSLQSGLGPHLPPTPRLLRSSINPGCNFFLVIIPYFSKDYLSGLHVYIKISS